MAAASRAHDIVVFHGRKFFWCTRNNIDVTMVYHRESGTVELIAYEPSLDMEAERIYLRSHVLRSKLNLKGSEAKQYNLVHTAECEEDTTIKQAESSFIFDHLFIKEYSKDDKKFGVELRLGEDHCDASLPLICAKPVELLPFEMKHHKVLESNVIDEVLQAREGDPSGSEEPCTNSTETPARTNVQRNLSYKERWRIPLVLVKLSKNKTLNETDSKIWAAVSSTFRTQEDIDSVVVMAKLCLFAPSTATTNLTPNGAYSDGPTPSPCQTPSRSPRARATSQRLFHRTTISPENACVSNDCSINLSYKCRDNQAATQSQEPTGTRSRYLTPRRASVSDNFLPHQDVPETAGVDKEKTSLIQPVMVGAAAFVTALLNMIGRTKTNAAGIATIACTANVEAPLRMQDCKRFDNEFPLRITAAGASSSTDVADEAVPAVEDHYSRLKQSGGACSGDRAKPRVRRSLCCSLLGCHPASYNTVHVGSEFVEHGQSSLLNVYLKPTTRKQTTASASVSANPISTPGACEGCLSFSAALAWRFLWSHLVAVVPVDLPVNA